MECERVRDQFLDALVAGGADPWSELVTRHVEGCDGCRMELDGLSQIWATLGQLPDVAPSEEIRRRLVRNVRRQLVRESVLTVTGWAPAVLAGAVGVGLSLALALLMPYSRLVSWCQQALELSDPHAAPYLLAGMAYGLPLALGGWIFRRRALSGAVIGGLEASVLFLVILAPFVIAQCREFTPLLQGAFVSGLGVGAVSSTLMGLGLARLTRSGMGAVRGGGGHDGEARHA
jgi:hypothetical protein